MELVEHVENCAGAEFRCYDNSCIDENGVLNGYPDCPDGSDESPDRGFRDCILPSMPLALHYAYTGNLTHDSCTPWEETPYSGRGLYGKICRSIPESHVRWPGCWSKNNETMEFDWIRCPIHSCKIRAGCYHDIGTDYMDTGQFTINGFRCIDWNIVSAEVFDIRMYPEIDFSTNNCRNPDGRERPWCFYLDNQDRLKSSFCEIDICVSDFLQQFRRYTKVSFDITSYRYLDIGNRPPSILSEEVCAEYCLNEQSFTCLSYTFRYEGTKNFQSNSCKWSDTAPTTVAPQDVFFDSPEEDTFVNIQNECDPFLVGMLPAGCPLPIGMKEDLYDDSKNSSYRPQIHNDNITASSALGDNNDPRFARFDGNSCWRPAPFDSEAWIQVDLEGLHIITGIVVQACGPEFPDWVYEFTVQSKTANNPFVSHRDARTETEVLQGNYENRCARLVEFDPRIYAESIRVLPVSSHGNPGLRFELLGCRNDCDFSTGLTDLQAPDSSITASSALRRNYNPRSARIQPLGIQSDIRLGWSPELPPRDAEPWIQISYPEHKIVKAVITQGCPLSDAYLKSFILYYTDESDADDEDDIFPYLDPLTGDVKVFTANSNTEALVRNDLPYEITAKFVRLIPMTWGGSGHPCMKFEIIGCPYKICGSSLKIGTKTIGEDVAIVGQGCIPESFVLNGPSTQGTYVTSVSTPRIVTSYLEVQLFQEYSITAIVTQGTLNNNGEWATKFTLEYARDVNDGFGFDYRPYVQINGQVEVFEANDDSVTPVMNQLDRPISVTKLKIAYYNDRIMSVNGPCIRLDLLGCKVSERGFPCGPGGLKSSGYCMGNVVSRDIDACSTTFHHSSDLAILSNPSIIADVNIQLRQILLSGFSHYLIGLQQVSDAPSDTFVWKDGTPLLYPENFDPDLEIDFSSTLCVAIDVLDDFSWKALPCLSPELSAASLCQFDIDECLQEADDCSDGCINYPGGFLCTCPHGSYLDTHEQHDCESLCDLYQMHTTSSVPDKCVEFYPDATFERAKEVCRQSNSRLSTAEELLLLLSDSDLILQKVWIEPEDPQDFRCYVAEIDISSSEVDCETNNTFICILDNLPPTFAFNTSVSAPDYYLTENSMYLTWTGLPPWFDSETSAVLDIRVQSNKIVRIYFVYINLRVNDNDGSCFDKLTLWENLISGGRRMQGEYCGNLHDFTLDTETYHVTFTLKIGELRRNLPRYLSLQLLYEGRECSTQECDVYCKSNGLVISDSQGQLKTFNFPEILPPYYSCVWTIQLPKGSFVKLIFREVIIPCSANYVVKVFSRQLSGTHLLDEANYSSLCEHSEAWTISETSKLIIAYQTGLNQESEGFEASYETSDTPGCRLEPKEGVEDVCILTECNFPSAFVASPNYPLLLMDPLICLWKIETSPKSFMHFQFVDINVQDTQPCDMKYVLITEESREVRFCGYINDKLPYYVSDRNALSVRFSFLNGNFLAKYEEMAFVPSTSVVLSSDSGYECPEGWYLFNRRCFVIKSAENLLRWTEALSSCIDETSNLVSIRNKAEMNFIHGLIVNGSRSATIFYIGLYRDPEMDNYIWTDGSPLSYTDWYSRKYEYQEIQPEGTRTEACTAINMKSFRTTDNWFDIPCAERTTDSFICAQPANHPDETYAVFTPIHIRNLACEIGYYRFGDICVKLVPIAHSVEVKDICPSGAGTASLRFLMSNLRQFEYHLSYIWQLGEEESNVGIIVITSNGNDDMVCFQRQQLGTFQINYSSCTAEEMFTLCATETTDHVQNCSLSQFRCDSGECLNVAFVCDFVSDCQDGSDEMGCSSVTNDDEAFEEECLQNNFKCNDGACIQISFVCDFVKHCPDGSDEISCEYPACTSDEATCTNKQCIPLKKWCNIVPDCVDGSDEIFCVTSGRNFQCYSGDWLPAQGYCDGQRDCPGRGFEDEPESCDYFQANFSCDSRRQILCKNGACADNTILCLMDHDRYGIVKGCRDLTHLQYCELFDCPDLFFKCPNSYCVPQHYRCDSKNDCPGGEDEVNCDAYLCPGAYKCRGSEGCLAQRHICDNISQCPDGDDEYFCGNKCPEGCGCSGLSYMCKGAAWNTNVTLAIPKNIKQLALLNLKPKQRIKRQLKQDFMVTIYDATFLSIEEYPLLFTLDLTGNGITHLGNRTFQSNKNLRKLNLSLNEINFLDQNSFHGLTRLTTLDLSGNRLTEVIGSPFKSLRMLTHLFLQDSNVITSDPEFVYGLESIQVFHSDRNYYCCLLEDTETLRECLPPRDEFSSCTDLIRSVTQKIIIWIMAVCALSGNIIVIILRLRKKKNTGQMKKTSAQPVLVMNLAIADLLMGCYLLMIAIADASYRGRYGLYADIWQTSFYCRLAGFLSTISSVASVLTLTVISLDRCQSVLYPLSPNRLSARSAFNVCLLIWTAMVIVSALPAVVFEGNYYGRSSVCLALPITPARPSGWIYSFVLFIILNVFLLIIIMTCYTIIFIIARRSTKFSTSLSKSDEQMKREQLQIAFKVSLLVASDLACWLPIVIMGFLAMTPRAVTGDVYAWTAIVVLPINSAVNPYLYTFFIERVRKVEQTSLAKSLTSSDNRVLISASSSPTVQRAVTPVTNDKDQSSVTKSALAAMRSNRVIAPSGTERYRSHQLSTLVSNSHLNFTIEDKEDIIEDVRKALQYLHNRGIPHGKINNEHIIIDELPHGNKRAYLLMASTTKPEPDSDKAKTSDIELTEMNVGPAKFNDFFEKDLRDFESFCSGTESMVSSK